MCKSPLLLVNPRYKKMARIFHVRVDCYNQEPQYKILVPCGHCDQCLKKRSQNWTLRAHHLINSGNIDPKQCLFCTLSIAPKNYNEVIKDPYKVFRQFIDRLRHHKRFRYKKNGRWCYRKVKFHYLAVIEFGDGSRAWERHKDTTYRMHFHCVFFGLPLYWWQVRNAWRDYVGWAWVSPLRSFAGVRYTIKYVTKDRPEDQVNDGLDRSKNGKLIVSHGFGRLNKEDKKRMRALMLSSDKAWFCIDLNGYHYSIPAYWKNACFTPPERRCRNDALLPPLLEKMVKRRYSTLDYPHQKAIYNFYLNF